MKLQDRIGLPVNAGDPGVVEGNAFVRSRLRSGRSYLEPWSSLLSPIGEVDCDLERLSALRVVRAETSQQEFFDNEAVCRSFRHEKENASAADCIEWKL